MGPRLKLSMSDLSYSAEGIEPASRFNCNLSTARTGDIAGMGPVRPFLCSLRSRSSERDCKLDGIDDVRELSAKLRLIRFVKLPIEEGMDPDRLDSDRVK